MNVNIASGEHLITVTLAGSCTIFEAAELRSQLLPLVKATQPVMVDLGDVSELDSSGLQILLALQKECALALFSNPSACVQQVLDLLNLNRCFAIEA